jgi:G:T-mismatch repair DNA endonuclease (very short patch repair protein)
MPKPLRPLKPTAEVSDRMRRVATKGTAPERRVRAVARRLKIRHTTQTSRLPGRPDLVLPNHNVADLTRRHWLQKIGTRGRGSEI